MGHRNERRQGRDIAAIQVRSGDQGEAIKTVLHDIKEISAMIVAIKVTDAVQQTQIDTLESARHSPGAH